MTDFRKVFWDAELEFNTSYQKFTEGMFLVKAVTNNPEEAIGALTNENTNFRDITKLLDVSSWNLANIFIGVTLGRFLLEFAQLFLALLSALLTIALRLFAPFAIALAIDRTLAQRISYPFAWSAGVFTLVTPLVSHILGLAVYSAGNLAFTIISPETGIFSLAANGVITGDPARTTPAVYACIIVMILMMLSALLLLASPYLSYKLAFGQIFEAVSTTASGWMGAFAATGMEIAGMKYGTALQRQAAETRLEGQYQAEQTRATASRDASNLTSRAQQIQGMQSAAASRSQALGAIAGGYAMSTQMAQAQRTASLGMIEQARVQQVTGIQADKSFGQQQTTISSKQAESEVRINQDERNITNFANRSMDWVDHSAGAVSSLGGQSLPLLPALRDAAKTVTGPARGINEKLITDAITDARVGNVRHARSGQIDNYDVTSQIRTTAANNYAQEAGKIADQQAAANIVAAKSNRDLAAGGVERGYRQQVHGINSAYQLNLEASQLQLAGALKAAEVVQTSGLKAIKLEQMSQLVTTLSRDLARRTEQALTLRY